jgi:hypothetical protein
MARDFYETTIALPDASGVVTALAGVKVSVVPRGAVDVAGSLVNIYGTDVTVAKLTHPIVTTANGAVRFWADGPAEYDIVFEDNIVPARVTDRYGWNCVPAKASDVPGSPTLVPPGGITQAMLAPAVVNNEVPIGGVIEWWRPNIAVPVPTGFVICDGTVTLAVGQHDFPNWNSPVTVPDLRNLFILGADGAKADGTGAAGDDTAGGGPGIRGSANGNKHTLGLTEMPSHNHGGATGPMSGNNPHGHTTSAGYANVAAGADWGVSLIGNYNPSAQVQGQSSDTDINHLHSIPSQGGGAGGVTVAHNNMPRWVGLLRIMKVKR